MAMRIRIIKPPTGVIDGIPMGLFRLGGVYDLHPALATCLMVEGWADDASDDALHAPPHPDKCFRLSRPVRDGD